MGIANKCFEILENRRSLSGSGDPWDGRPESRLGGPGGALEEDDGGAASEAEDEEDDSETNHDGSSFPFQWAFSR